MLPTFIVSLGQPLFYLITFGVGMGAYMGYSAESRTCIFWCPACSSRRSCCRPTFECLYGTFVKMVHEHLYDSLIATPVSAEDAVAGDIAWGAFRGLLSGVLMLIVAVFMGVLRYPRSMSLLLLSP